MNQSEHLSPDAWRQWHTELLQSTVNRVYNRVLFYRQTMDTMGISPADIRTVEDLERLPFTTRKDLADNYPYDIFAVPLRDIIRIHTLRSAHTTPLVMGYTKQDLEHRQGLTARFLDACGVSPDDIVQICLDRGMAVWGQELKEGAETLGALVIPPDPLSTSARLRVLVDFKTTVLITTPSYGRYLLDELRRGRISPASLSLRRGVFIGETLSDAVRGELEEGFGLQAFSGYGILEAVGPGMAYECRQRCGLHLAMDHFIPEIVDPNTGQGLPHGQPGELVITTVTTRANPLLRFRTGDLTRILPDPCPCGRTTWRIAPVEDRCDDLVSVRGVKMDPVQIDSFIAAHTGGSALPFVVILRPWKALRRVELWVAMREDLFQGSLPELHDWIRRLESSFEEEIGLACRVCPVEFRTLEPMLSRGRKIITTEME